MNHCSNAPDGCGLLRPIHATIGRLAVVVLLGALSASVRADEPPPPDYESHSRDTRVDVRYDGVLAESYGYHRQAASQQSITSDGGQYRYGFPVKTYRWGWFGAAHYYPYVVWHRGYNGDCVRWGYRRGY